MGPVFLTGTLFLGGVLFFAGVGLGVVFLGRAGLDGFLTGVDFLGRMGLEGFLEVFFSPERGPP